MIVLNKRQDQGLAFSSYICDDKLQEFDLPIRHRPTLFCETRFPRHREPLVEGSTSRPTHRSSLRPGHTVCGTRLNISGTVHCYNPLSVDYA